MKDYPYFPSVPQGYQTNMTWRLKVLEAARSDGVLQEQLREMCRQDLLFFISGFSYLYEPRPRRGPGGVQLPTIIPFIPWTHQIPAIKLIDEALGFEDIALEKSRGEGASWIAMTAAVHRWGFFDHTAIGLVSRNELAGDNPDDPDSLFYKVDMQLDNLPVWMFGKKDEDWVRSSVKHTLRHLHNSSTITSYAAVGDVGSGGRKTFFFIDELAKFRPAAAYEALDSTGPVTDSRLIVSTPKGSDGAYYDLMHADNKMVRIVLDWKDNQTRNRGMFRIQKAGHQMLCEPVDVARYGFPESEWVVSFLEHDLKRLADRGYAANDPNKWWSPWYVKQCLRPGATPRSMAQEYDRDYGGSTSKFFNIPVIDRLLTETVKQPLYVGDLQFDSTQLSRSRFLPNPGGNLRIWCPLIQDHYPATSTDYVVGADIASGKGGVQSSNSALSVVDRQTGHKVAEYASPNISPELLANYAIALCMWFRGKSQGGHLIWEDNGYGGQFRNRVFETQFRNYYYRVATEETTRKRSRKPGFSTNKKTKNELLGQYGYALSEGLYVNPSRIALQECKDYMILPGGRVEHQAGVASEDPSGAGENHGDRVIADALTNWVLYLSREGRREYSTITIKERNIPPTCLLALKASEEKKKQDKSYW